MAGDAVTNGSLICREQERASSGSRGEESAEPAPRQSRFQRAGHGNGEPTAGSSGGHRSLGQVAGSGDRPPRLWERPSSVPGTRTDGQESGWRQRSRGAEGLPGAGAPGGKHQEWGIIKLEISRETQTL